ncbi:MAG: 1-deoxy-D-xylulose-5-phosphate synthase [Candidatus Omnitrophica bacterium]|nr:1-deoxy-D-xylulose-5-phosphate synthase [Candidatus Omnitrophota bacterium]
MLLEAINSPQDLRKLSIEQLPALAGEIRERIVTTVCATGGHLASSLGAVELIIALHYCLDTPRDKILFDVGHQAYAHKILTGRNREFTRLRQYEGISGFPDKQESPYDVFTAGHSSTAVSLALGLAVAQGAFPAEERFKVAAVIGDGSLSGGLCFEGLNNAGHLKKDLLVVLNTNEMSIAPNVGAISTYLNKIISLPIYNRFKVSLEGFVRSRMPKGSRLIKLANKFEEGLKGLFVPGMLFEELGFRYFGPFDGHNLELLIKTLKNLASVKGPILFHVVTKKGKGYAPAENDPVKFHSAPKLSGDSGGAAGGQAAKSYTEVFSEKLVELAGGDERIFAITAAMPEGTGLDKFRDSFPGRFFDVGIAEAHAACFASGLARAGLKPVVAVYSTFLQRAYDQLIEDVCLQDLAVIFVLDRAGIVGEDGVSHQGTFDLAYLGSIPNLIVMAPADAEELKAMLEFAVKLDKPVAIRYPKDKITNVKLQMSPSAIRLGKGEVLREGKDFTLIALGSMVAPCWEACEELEKEGLSGTLVNARFLKPLDEALCRALCAKTKKIFTAEEGILEGGFASLVAMALSAPVAPIGLPCEFIAHGKRELLLEKYGLSAKGIAARIRSSLH